MTTRRNSSTKSRNTSADSFSPRRLQTLKSKDAVATQLKALHEKLLEYEVPVDDSPHAAWLERTWPLLLEDQFLNHQHKDIRLLTCCCIVEILAVYAPNTPFSREQLESSFGSIITELRGLQAPEKHAYPRVLSMLESLATVRSCLCVVNLAEKFDNTSHVAALFQVLLQSARPTHTPTALTLMLEVMKACIEGFSGPVPHEVLNIVVETLLKDSGTQDSDNVDDDFDAQSGIRTGAALAADLCRSPQMEKPLQMFLNHLAIGHGSLHQNDSDEEGDVSSTERSSPLQDRVFDVAAKLASVSDGLLLKALPSLCINLTNPNRDVRAPVIEFVGGLFAAEGSRLPTLFSTTFRQWLERFQDCDVEIRKSMLDSASDILYNNEDPEVLQAVQKSMKAKLSDPDKEVRRRAVQCICGLAGHGCSNVTDDLLRGVGDRCIDRVAVIRKEAITGLAQIYKHVLAMNSEPNSHSNQDRDRIEKQLGWIPGHVIRTFNIDDAELRCRVLQLIDEILLPKTLTATLRAQSFIHIFQNLTEDATTVLGRIFAIRRHVQDLVRRFALNPTEHQAASVFQKFAMSFRGVEISHVEALRSIKDKKVFSLLASLAAPDGKLASLRAKRVELLKRVGSKSPQASMLKNILRYACMTTVDVDSIEVICDQALADKERNSRSPQKNVSTRKSKVPQGSGDCFDIPPEANIIHKEKAAMDLLILLATHFPAAVVSCTNGIVSAMMGRASNDFRVDAAAKCFSLIATEAACTQNLAIKTFIPIVKKQYVSSLLNHSPQWAKRVMKGLCAYIKALPEKNTSTYQSILQTIAQKLVSRKTMTLNNARIDSAFEALGIIATNNASVMENEIDEVVEFATSHCLTVNPPAAEITGGRKRSNPAWRSVHRAAMNFLVRAVAGTSSDVGSNEKSEKQRDRIAGIVENITSAAESVANRVHSNKSNCTKNEEHLLVCACRALLKIAGLTVLNAKQWHILAFSLRDTSLFVRSTMLQHFKSTFVKYNVRPQFMCALALVGAEPRNSKANLSAALQLKGLAQRQRACYARAMQSQEDTDGLHLEFLQVESCIGHFIHLLAHHPALTSASALKAAKASAMNEGKDGEECLSPSRISLIHLVRARPGSILHSWAAEQGRHGLLKEFSDQMDLLLRVIFGGSSNMDNVALVKAILSAILAAEDALDRDNLNIHVITEMMQAKVDKLTSKAMVATQSYPGTIRLDAKCFAATRRRQHGERVSGIGSKMNMSSLIGSPEKTQLDGSMQSFFNTGRDTLLPADFDVSGRQRKSTTGESDKPKRKSPVSREETKTNKQNKTQEDNSPAKRKASKSHFSSPAKIKARTKTKALPSRRSKRVANAPRPSYAEDSASEADEDYSSDDESVNQQKHAISRSTKPPSSKINNEDQENDADQAKRQNVAHTLGPQKSQKDLSKAKLGNQRPSFRSTRSRRR